jgi:eukaryotic-like serine/threonine-protein kinase
MGLQSENSIHPGDRIDHYVVEALVASGGMASVFRARDISTGHPVAVKIPHPQNGGDHSIDRLRREAEIGSKLNHPSLARIVPNESGSGRYVIMEWLEGKPLREIIDLQRRLPALRAVGIMLRLCDALEYIHGQGIVHRDLKPENVIVYGDDAIKLIDFGIARQTSLGLWTRRKDPHALGTPDYAAPEQARGKRSDARSDIYSAGIILFEMLTGEVPFSGLPPALAMRARQLVDAPELHELDPEISPQLEAIVSRSIARDRNDRYASAHALASDLSLSLAAEHEAPVESLVNA